jgi:hypothetical protein
LTWDGSAPPNADPRQFTRCSGGGQLVVAVGIAQFGFQNFAGGRVR